MDTSLIAFLTISVIVIVTPGPDTALTIRNAIAGGGRAGWATAAGVSAGQLVWSAATSLGLVGLLLASEPVFHALRWVGALYLVYLGLQSLRAAWHGGSGARQEDAPGSRGPLQLRAALTQGLINDLANPKMAAFFASVLPQFVTSGPDAFFRFMLLGTLFALLTFVWLGFYVLLIRTARDVLHRPGVRRTLDGIAGVTMIGLGVRVAVSER